MAGYVLDFQDMDHTHVALVGGKGAHLGELSRVEGINVPAGFCVTTDAFRRIIAEVPAIDAQLDRLSRLKPDDRDALRILSAELRRSIEAVVIPDDITTAIARTLAQLGAEGAYAVRSSATAEDLPTASFAGQQDTYLDVTGSAAVIEHVRRCWASLFTERAVSYRVRNGFDHRKVQMAVVVQRMIFPQVSGILFTADPLTGNRKVAIVEASFGLGEALVSGHVNADAYALRDNEVTVKNQRQERPALTEQQVVRLAQMGRVIEAHFGRPQDIEWCLADDDFHIVQSRPITTLFPIPRADDGENHVYLSVAHQQMMTDAMKPLGISMWQLTAAAPMHEAGGRLWVDVSRQLASPAARAGLLAMMERSDPPTRDAVQVILDRGDFIVSVPEQGPGGPPLRGAPTTIATDATIPAELIARNEASVAKLKRDIQGKSSVELLDFILADIQEGKRVLFDPQGMQVIMAGMESYWWLNDQILAWLGEKNAGDVLTQSVPHNVTSEMGLALLDVADVIRPYPGVVAFLQQVQSDDFLDELPRLDGGEAARGAIRAWLDKYGMRGAGEIDITRPRWSERPGTLLPILLGNIRNFEAGASARRAEQGRQEAARMEEDLLERLRALSDGAQKADETRRMIERVRTFAGYREYPKYGKVRRDFVYKQALMEEAGRLVQARVIREREDVFFLTLQELRDVASTGQVDEAIIRERKDAFRSYEALTPPRVLTSDGEGISGSYRREGLPAGALVGLAVSAGTIEGRARVVLDMAAADLEPGDILVTAFTDPSWTPVFVSVAGLVTEVGGLMTHGAVIAREYGLPAVVGVENATRLIRDGQRIRVHGTEGYVEILP